MQTNDILNRLKEIHNINKDHLELILDSQFKLTYNSLNNRTTKSVKWIHLGKIKPTSYFINNYEELVKKSKTDI